MDDTEKAIRERMAVMVSVDRESMARECPTCRQPDPSTCSCPSKPPPPCATCGGYLHSHWPDPCPDCRQEAKDAT